MLQMIKILKDIKKNILKWERDIKETCKNDELCNIEDTITILKAETKDALEVFKENSENKK